jgi:peroxiredoxin/outer membrane lipoprotein-sorting protein
MSLSRVFKMAVSGIRTAICVFTALASLGLPTWGRDAHRDSSIVADEPTAHAHYNQMIDAMHRAKSLSYVCRYQHEATGRFQSGCTYRVWLKKPNFFRMETQTLSGKQGGILIGDGKALWIFWPSGLPQWEYVPESDADKTTRFSSYMTKPAPPGQHSIWHEARFLAAGMSFPILDASTFHGHVDSIEPHVDGVRGLGAERIGNEDCDKIEVRMIGGQRLWTLWLSKRDHLPRKLQEIVHVSYDVVTNEEWSSVVVNFEIPDSRFAWKPPAGWKEWKLADDDDHLLKPRSKAPDFELTSLGGERLRLSSYRGKSVWLCFWRVGCPPCLDELPYLQRLYEKCKDQGLVVLGVNCADDRNIVADYLRKHGVTFPQILDTSAAAEKVCYEEYGNGTVPLNYLIDGQGVIVDAWFGNSSKSHEREKAALRKIRGDWAESVP